MAGEERVALGSKNSLFWCCIVAIVLLVSGCSSTTTQNPVKREIKQGGELVYGSLQEPDTLNPLLSDLLSTA